MSLHSLPTFDVATKIKSLSDNLSLNQNRINLLKTILPVLKAFDGKKPGKRFETAIKNALGGTATTHLERGTDYSNPTIYIWGNGIEYCSRIFLILYTDDGLFNYKNFSDDINATINIYEINSKKTMIGIQKGTELLEEWNKVLGDLKDIKNELGEMGINF